MLIILYHIVDQRFGLGIEDTIAVTKAEHNVFTQGMRTILPYGKSYTVTQIWNAAQSVYKDYPAVLNAIKLALGL